MLHQSKNSKGKSQNVFDFKQMSNYVDMLGSFLLDT